MKKISFGNPILGKKELKSISEVLKSKLLVHGPVSKKFEKEFSNFTKSSMSVSVSSCTAGMHLIYFTAGIGNGDEVIVPAQTHVATAHAVELAGAKAIFVDCEKDTGNIDITKIENKITKKTKAICVVHFVGIPVDMKKINDLAKKYKLLVIEDCALALGSKINNKHVGLFGDFGVFSFYPVKHMTTAEGGMIISKNKKFYKSLVLNRAFGVNKNFSERKISGMYDCEQLGFNYRMSEVHSSIGVEQLKKLKSFIKKRIINYYYLKKKLNEFKNIKILDKKNKNFFASYYCLTFYLKNKSTKFRNNIIQYLNSLSIGCSIYYPQPVPRMLYYKQKYGYKSKNYLNSELISDSSISLPIGPHINLKDLDYIHNSLKKVLI